MKLHDIIFIKKSAADCVLAEALFFCGFKPNQSRKEQIREIIIKNIYLQGKR